MADKDEKNKEVKKPEAEAAKPEKSEKPQQTGAKTGILMWLIMAVVVVLFAGSGFALGRLLAGSFSPSPETAESSQENTQEHKKESKKEDKKESAHGSKKEGKKTEEVKSENSQAGLADTWYYNELESVVVNPDEPGATRFVRVGLTLEISSELSQEKAKELIDTKKPLLVNWLNLYFKSLTLGEMQNDRDMKRILLQICDAFNENLFPGDKPKIKKILIREFNIQ
ncbi:MAG: flagellar basal body-associated FliL family protein [Phycisphaerae bacterium]|nr:flagellar basal body-associated FliL family protein [Phycisphaerae bacterium]